MQKFLAVIAGKIVLFTLRALKMGGGSALPGLIALKIDPELLKKFSLEIKYGAILITGTNGKTTASRFLQNILKNAGFKTISNRTGSNLKRGIVSTFIENANYLGKANADLTILEIDKATMPEITLEVKTKAVAVTNLFRDRLDRYDELDKTAKIIDSSFNGFGGIS